MLPCTVPLLFLVLLFSVFTSDLEGQFKFVYSTAQQERHQ